MGARRYSFKNDERETVEGVKLFYLLPDDVYEERDERGLFPFTASVPLECFHQLSALPGEYELEERSRPGRDGRKQTVVTGLRYVGGATVGVSPNHSTV